MKIASWSLDSISTLLDGDSLFHFVNREKPDVIFFQNLNTQNNFSSLEESGALGINYSHIKELSNREDGVGGCAVFIRDTILSTEVKELDEDGYDPQITRSVKGKVVSDEFEGRVQALSIRDIIFINFVQVNAGENMEFANLKGQLLKYLSSVIGEVTDSSFPKLVILGDFKTVLKNEDVHNKVLRQTSGFSETERNQLSSFIQSNGLIDVYRSLYPFGSDWTFYPKLGYGKRYGKGWRIDYVLSGKGLAGKITNFRVLKDVNGSSHVPIIFELEE